MNVRQKPLVWILLAAAASLLITAIILLPSGRPAPPAREVPARELTLRDGRSYWKEETTSFTGFITERYLDGSLKSRSALSNGLLHGVSEGWYTNGTLQVREYFREGVSHGLREKWFTTGARMSQATIRTGKLEGVFKRWHENGALAEEIQLKDGNPEGISTAYHADGSLKTSVTSQNGRVIEQTYRNTGELNDSHANENTIPSGTPAL